ncbi:hypothetical protein SLEP1_g11044 [Rubroshorea leprosula]|uniref:Uncharacterized protein n=1 Tax=Rubroshorea leprosula TaxID=152421 RepID=A0AAV5IJI0_9ROSI|nr:hypothetical protein SLEP1_g11044 [Rubroshorea leprosula]
MASFNCFPLAFFMALSFSSINFGLAAGRLQQRPPLSPLPNVPAAIGLPPLPFIPTLPQPSLPSALPPLPTMLQPTLPTAPKVTLPPLPSIRTMPQPTLPTAQKSLCHHCL